MSGISAAQIYWKIVPSTWTSSGKRTVPNGWAPRSRHQNLAVDAECSQRRESTSDSSWINLDRYWGAAVFRQRCTRTQSLYWMRSGTRSQCKFTSSGVTWSNLHASAVSCAAGHNFLNWHLTLRSFHYCLYVRCILSWGCALGPFRGLSTWKEGRKDMGTCK